MSPRLIFRLIRCAFALYGVAYIACALAKPELFRVRFSLADRLGRDPRPRWLLILKLAGTLAGVGVLVYLAAFAISDLIPGHWTSVDEDGEISSLRMRIHWGLVVFGTGFFVAGLEKAGLDAFAALHARRGNSN